MRALGTDELEEVGGGMRLSRNSIAPGNASPSYTGGRLPFLPNGKGSYSDPDSWGSYGSGSTYNIFGLPSYSPPSPASSVSTTTNPDGYSITYKVNASDTQVGVQVHGPTWSGYATIGPTGDSTIQANTSLDDGRIDVTGTLDMANGLHFSSVNATFTYHF